MSLWFCGMPTPFFRRLFPPQRPTLASAGKEETKDMIRRNRPLIAALAASIAIHLAVLSCSSLHVSPGPQKTAFMSSTSSRPNRRNWESRRRRRIR